MSNKFTRCLITLKDMSSNKTLLGLEFHQSSIHRVWPREELKIRENPKKRKIFTRLKKPLRLDQRLRSHWHLEPLLCCVRFRKADEKKNYLHSAEQPLLLAASSNRYISLSKDVVHVQRWLSEHLIFFILLLFFGFYVILLQRDSRHAIGLAISQAQGKHCCSQRNTRKYTSCRTTMWSFNYVHAEELQLQASTRFRHSLWAGERESESELRCDSRATEK